MDLTTRCPKCGTVFQAGLSDLQLRKGYIRCVQCAHIFDGYAEVVS
ncbi:MAG: zinc-ribbon domain-containing protein, partial [Castellaniella sp.]